MRWTANMILVRINKYTNKHKQTTQNSFARGKTGPKFLSWDKSELLEPNLSQAWTYEAMRQGLFEIEA